MHPVCLIFLNRKILNNLFIQDVLLMQANGTYINLVKIYNLTGFLPVSRYEGTPQNCQRNVSRYEL